MVWSTPLPSTHLCIATTADAKKSQGWIDFLNLDQKKKEEEEEKKKKKLWEKRSQEELS